MTFDIIKFIEKTHPFKIIFYGCFMISIGLNIMQHSRIGKLLEISRDNTRVRIILIPIPKDQPYTIPHIEQPEELFTSKKGGVKVSTTISELCKQVVVDRPATLKVD